MAFQMIGKFKRVSRADNKNLLKWTSKDYMLFDEDEEIVAFERKPKGFIEVDKVLKRSKHFWMSIEMMSLIVMISCCLTLVLAMPKSSVRLERASLKRLTWLLT